MLAEQLIHSKKRELEELCERYAISRLRLFGSALRSDWDPESSDFDFIAEFVAVQNMNPFDRYMGFIMDLEALFGRKVDVVDWNAAKNPYFRRHAEQTAKELYAA